MCIRDSPDPTDPTTRYAADTNRVTGLTVARPPRLPGPRAAGPTSSGTPTADTEPPF
ncbi:hypothetical protein HGK34_20400, partial [Myceligenerans sp. I2]|nr:hypothetical protein [Myceligenerans indicum]